MTLKYWMLTGTFAVLACNAGVAEASTLSPCLRVLTYQNGQFGQERIRRINRCSTLFNVFGDERSAAVHEHMTIGSILQYRRIPAFAASGPSWKFQYMRDDDWWVKEGVRHDSHAIIFGTWWNDDPLMRTWGQGLFDFVFGSYDSIKSLKDENGNSKSTYPGGTRSCSVAAAQHLGRESHYGKLQHLHFMTTVTDSKATPMQRVHMTTDAALAWFAFAYAVATRKISPDTPFTPEMEARLSLPSIAANHCVNDSGNVKVRTLFSRLGQSIAYRDRIVSDVALGSMLHILQDSFSPSHTCRVVHMTSTGQMALLADVEDYNKQSAHAHGYLDGFPEWFRIYAETGRHVYENDPVLVGEWLLNAVDNDKPWPEVETFLRQTIFAFDESGKAVPNAMCMGRDVILPKSGIKENVQARTAPPVEPLQ